MITAIHIEDVATFEKESISDFNRVNFIYGANGSGKTTISNVIQSVGQYVGCEIHWQENRPLDVLVYNRKFVKQNFGRTEIPGVFVLGSATKEAIQTVESEFTGV